MDAEANILMCNQQALALLGYQASTTSSVRVVSKIVAPEDHERLAQNLQEVKQRGFLRNVEYTLLRRDGSALLADLSASVVRDSAAGTAGTLDRCHARHH